MKDYRKYSASDFAKDEYFQSWIHHTNAGNEAFWRRFLAHYPEKSGEIQEAREILTSLTVEKFVMPSQDVSALWQRIQEQTKSAPAPRRNTGRWYWAVAAAVLVAGASISLFLRSDELIQYQTGFGETRSILLADSSVVILNANSRISMRADMEQLPTREVQIDGEAYFSVVHKKDNKPFLVKTSGGVAVEVLGTSFNVYDREQTKVVLNSGQIQLSLPGSSYQEKILMKPGELVEYKQNKYSKRTVNPNVYAAWTEKKLILDQTSLREIVDMARNNYGIDIKVASDAMLDQTVSGSMPIGDAESFVMHGARAFQLKVTRQGKGYLLTESIQ